MSKKTKNNTEVKKPFLTVYVPTYMRPKLMANCLNHLEDVYKAGVDLEVLVYDSSTNNETEAVVNTFLKNRKTDFPIDYIHKDYENALWKNVAAHTKAKGEYITYLADDDYLIIDNLKEALHTLKHNPQIHGWFATWQLWDDQNEQPVNHYNNQSLNWMTSENKTYGMENVIDLTKEVVMNGVCPEIFILKTDTGRKVMMDWRHPEEQTSLFVLFRTLRFGRIHLTNAPFYRFSQVRKNALLENDHESQTHFGERLYKEAPFMTRFSREWFVAQAFREAGHQSIPEDAQEMIFKALNFEYIQRLKANGQAAAIRHKEYQLAHRYLSTMAGWDEKILPKDELYKFERFYLVSYALQTIENQIEHVEDKKKIQIFGFGNNDVKTYFENKLGNQSIESIVVNTAEDLDNDAIILVPELIHRKKLLMKKGLPESKVIALEDVMNTLRMIPDPISCEAFTQDGFKI